MARTLLRVLPVVALAFALSSCMSTTRYVPVGSSSGSSSSSSGASLVVVNNAPASVFYLYASPCSSSSWGPDRLDSDQVISSGETVSFTMTPGCWDLKAEFSDGRETVRRNAQISASAWRWTLG